MTITLSNISSTTHGEHFFAILFMEAANLASVVKHMTSRSQPLEQFSSRTATLMIINSPNRRCGTAAFSIVTSSATKCTSMISALSSPFIVGKTLLDSKKQSSGNGNHDLQMEYRWPFELTLLLRVE